MLGVGGQRDPRPREPASSSPSRRAEGRRRGPRAQSVRPAGPVRGGGWPDRVRGLPGRRAGRGWDLARSPPPLLKGPGARPGGPGCLALPAGSGSQPRPACAGSRAGRPGPPPPPLGPAPAARPPAARPPSASPPSASPPPLLPPSAPPAPLSFAAAAAPTPGRTEAGAGSPDGRRRAGTGSPAASAWPRRERLHPVAGTRSGEWGCGATLSPGPSRSGTPPLPKPAWGSGRGAGGDTCWVAGAVLRPLCPPGSA